MIAGQEAPVQRPAASPLARPLRLALPPLRPPVGGTATWALLAPALALTVMLLIVPTLWLVRLSLLESGAGDAARFYVPSSFTLAQYRQVLTDPYFGAVVWSTVRLALVTGAVCLAVAYPLAVWITRARRPVGGVALWLVSLPKLTNALVVLYGVLLLLGNAGLLNRALLALGVIRTPLPLFANLFAVVTGEVLLVVPYPVMMVAGALWAGGRELREMEEAARGLGASPLRAFLETTFRLTLPGAALALLVTLVWAAGAFAAPLVLGNPALYTAAVEIHTQTFERLNWPLAAALAIVHLAIVAALAAAALTLHGRRATRRRTSPPALSGLSQVQRAKPALSTAEGCNGRPELVEGMQSAHNWGVRDGSTIGTSSGTRTPLSRERNGVRAAAAEAVDRRVWDRTLLRMSVAARGWSFRDRMTGWFGRSMFHAFALLTLAVLLCPLVFSLLVSLTPEETIGLPAPERGLSLRWYVALGRDPLWLRAFAHSLLTAAVATGLAVPAGALAAAGIDRLPDGARRGVTLLLIAPLFVPGAVLGLQALALSYRLGLWGTPYSTGLAHAMWTAPLAFLVVRAALRVTDRRLEEVARGLGAPPVAAFCLITLPRLWPALAAAAFLCAVMSLNELPMALFLATASNRTLPTLIWPQLRYNLTPIVAAASSVLLLLTIAGLLVAAVLAGRLVRRSERPAGAPDTRGDATGIPSAGVLYAHG
ncbi:MAG: ABC transporter permease subunit [Chloroflexi bacterium]|nr:ABC transporter permease subunit [Chloroflexota bacterium]